MATRTTNAVVSATAPLTVQVYGEDPPVDLPAETVTSYTPVVDDVVRIELRTPNAPYILGAVG